MLADEWTAIILAALAVLMLGALLYLRLRPRKRRRTRRARNYSTWTGAATPRPRLVVQQTPAPDLPAPDPQDPAQHLHAIAKVEFECTPLHDRPEHLLLPLLESTTRDLRAGHRVMGRTSLDELIRPRSGSTTEADRTAALAAITDQHLDFAIIDRAGRLALAVEWHSGTDQESAALLRGAVKREVIRRAGIPLIEVEAGFDPALLRSRITGLLAPAKPAAVTDLNSRRL